jgi:SAM-dependent methyltransferase
VAPLPRTRILGGQLTGSPEAVERYRQILHRHLTDRPASEVEFFVNERRFELLTSLLGPDLNGRSILNAASGPFAFEVFVAPAGATIDSFDIDALLPAVHSELKSLGMLGESRFQVADMMSFESDRRYDLVLINDVFFLRFVDFFAALPRYAQMLEPGGYLYFDILDRRAAAIWSLVNNDQRYRRYDMAEVRAALAENGLELLQMVPSPGIKGGLDGAMRRLLWAGGRIANNFAFLARKTA